MLKIFLWFRYLQKRRIVLLSIGAVALSAALLIIVSSLFNGFINVLERSAVDMLGEVVIASPARFAKYPEFIEQLEKIEGVKAATATLTGHGLLHLGKGNVRRVVISGIDPLRQGRVTGLERFLLKAKEAGREAAFEVEGHPEKVGGIVGIGLVAEPDEKTDEYNFAEIGKIIGEQAVLITAGQTTGDAPSADGGFKIRNLPFTIKDVAFTGVYDFDSDFVYVPIDALQKELYPDETEKVAKQVQIRLKPDVNADGILPQIQGAWESFAKEQLGWDEQLIMDTVITTTRQMQSQWVAELRKQMGVLLLIFGVISLSVILLIFCIFYMIVITRLKDIAIIKSCGANGGAVAMIFIGFGTFIGITGSALGIILGAIVTKNINIIERWISNILGLKLWKSSSYIFSRIPSEVDWDSVLPIVLSAIIAAALGALVPAIIAIRTRPVKILRYE